MFSATQRELVHEVYRAQADRSPEAPAISWLGPDARDVSFRELLHMSQHVAKELGIAGVRPGSFVGTFVNDGVEQVVCQLATMMAGAAFVPLESSWPSSRLSFVTQDMSMPLVLVARSQVELLRSQLPGSCPQVSIDELLSRFGEEEHAQQGREQQGQRELQVPCYAVFTSGSTGQPKAVVGSHANLMAFILAYAARNELRPSVRVLLASGFSFDPSLGETFAALCVGATLCVPPRHRILPSLGELLLQSKANYVWCTPGLFQTVRPPDAGVQYPQLRSVGLGGEALPRQLQENWCTAVRLSNQYGVTEATVTQCSRQMHLPSSVEQGATLGPAYDGTQLLLLDGELNPITAVGEEGQLVVTGMQVTCGYHNRAELTAASFLPTQDITGLKGCLPAYATTLYLTGDVACWVQRQPGAGTDLRFLGRYDSQVKIRGQRVELAEVEAALLLCRLVVASAVLLHEEQLLACVVLAPSASLPAHAQQQPDEVDLRMAPEAWGTWQLLSSVMQLHLEAALPAHMVPHRFMPLQRLPQTDSGKVDRRALVGHAQSWQQVQRQHQQAEEDEEDEEEEEEKEEEDHEAEQEDEREHQAPQRHGLRAAQRQLQRAVADAWREVLGSHSLGPIGGRAHFLRLGGDSLKALRVVRTLLTHTGVSMPGETDAATALLFDAPDAGRGVMHGTFSPMHVVRLPFLATYASWLFGQGVRVASAAEVAPEAVATTAAPLHLQGSQGQLRAGTTLHEDAIVDMPLAKERAARSAETLHACSGAGHHGAVLACLDTQLDPDGGMSRKQPGFAPLHAASAAGHVRVVRALIDARASLTVFTTQRQCPAHYAAAADHSEVLQLLLGAKAPLLCKDCNDQTLLHHAARGGSTACLRQLCGHGLQLGHRDRWLRTPLHWAVLNAHVEAATFLVQARADVNPAVVPRHKVHTHLLQEPPLHIAARTHRGQLQLMRMLLQAKAAVTARDMQGRTPLHTAATYKCDEDAESDPEAKQRRLHTACEGMRLLLEHGAGSDVNAVDAAGDTPAQLAAQRGQTVALQLLQGVGAHTPDVQA